MGSLAIKFCDMCGKRTENLIGTLHLSKGYQYKKPHKRTQWTKRLCLKCTNQLTNVKMEGDSIYEKMELSLDKLYVENKSKELKCLEEFTT